MKKTVSLKENHEFRRLYHRGVSTAGKHVVIYCRRNKLGYNRLGLTVSAKLACAVKRNRIKRLFREAYRGQICRRHRPCAGRTGTGRRRKLSGNRKIAAARLEGQQGCGSSDMKRLLLAMIRFYRRYISPSKPPCCRYIPTCSQYAIEAIEKYGAIKGGWLAFKRICRCNPFSKRGPYDPVP